MRINRVLLKRFIEQYGGDQDRCTGRTLGIAFAALGDAMKNPGLEVVLKDHHPSREADKNLAGEVEGIIHVLGLRFLELKHKARGNHTEYILRYNPFVEVDL